MKKGLRKLEAEIRDASREFEEREPLLNLSYDRLADGGRRKYRGRPDPERDEAIRRAFGTV